MSVGHEHVGVVYVQVIRRATARCIYGKTKHPTPRTLDFLLQFPLGKKSTQKACKI